MLREISLVPMFQIGAGANLDSYARTPNIAVANSAKKTPIRTYSSKTVPITVQVAPSELINKRGQHCM